MGRVRRVQMLKVAVWILYCSNTLGKYMNQTIIPPAMGKVRTDLAF